MSTLAAGFTCRFLSVEEEVGSGMDACWAEPGFACCCGGLRVARDLVLSLRIVRVFWKGGFMVDIEDGVDVVDDG